MSNHERQRILLVDDEMELCDALEEYLGEEGYDICSAHDGEEAISRFLDFHPEVVLLDIRMPKLNGLDALKIIHEGSHVPVIMMTAVGDQEMVQKCMDTGAENYIFKPIDLVDLDEKICEALHVG